MARPLTCLAFIVGMALAPSGWAVASPGFVDKADALLRQHAAQGDFSGVVIVAVHGKPVLERAYGLANREWDAPVTTDSEFKIGSTTKQFTAAAIMLLRDSGSIQLDQHIGDILRDIPATWKSITLLQLLTHTSGIPDYTQVSGFIRTGARLNLTPKELLDLVKEQPLEAAPGSTFKYNNSDYVLLGLVIEKVSGVSYAQYLREHVLCPLGLSSTDYDVSEVILPKRAAGYEITNGHAVNARPMTAASTYSAGGLRSTAEDLLRWNTALHGGRLLQPSTVREMFTDYGHGYGFGAFIETRAGHKLWDHGGNLTGFSSAFEFYPDDDLLVVILTNVEGTGSEHLAKELGLEYFSEQRAPVGAQAMAGNHP